eukprot:scaffold36879_cov99-Phaeocystis_antarctica.AAC.4
MAPNSTDLTSPCEAALTSSLVILRARLGVRLGSLDGLLLVLWQAAPLFSRARYRMYDHSRKKGPRKGGDDNSKGDKLTERHGCRPKSAASLTQDAREAQLRLRAVAVQPHEVAVAPAARVRARDHRHAELGLDHRHAHSTSNDLGSVPGGDKQPPRKVVA